MVYRSVVLLSQHPVRFQDPTRGTVVYTGEQGGE